MFAGYSLYGILVLVVIAAAGIAIVGVVVSRMGVAIPGWLAQVGWILVAALVGVIALALLFELAARLRA